MPASINVAKEKCKYKTTQAFSHHKSIALKITIQLLVLLSLSEEEREGREGGGEEWIVEAVYTTPTDSCDRPL